MSLSWTFDRVLAEFGEDVLRRIVGEVNDLMCGYAGYGIPVNRLGVAEETWRKLLKRGGASDEGIGKVLGGGYLNRKELSSAFQPFTIRTIFNVVEDKGGPLTAAEAASLIETSLRQKELLK